VSPGPKKALAFVTRTGRHRGCSLNIAGGLVGSDMAITKSIQEFIDVSGQDNVTMQVTPTNSKTNWISSLYKNLLGREISNHEKKAWTKQVEDGVSEKTILNFLMVSQENICKKIVDTYSHLLDRAPSLETLHHWTENLRKGKKIEALIQEISLLPEYELSARGSQKTLIEKLIQDLWGRTPQTHEAQAWEGLLHAQAIRMPQLVQTFLAEEEYIRNKIEMFFFHLLNRKIDESNLKYYRDIYAKSKNWNQVIQEIVLSHEYKLLHR